MSWKEEIKKVENEKRRAVNRFTTENITKEIIRKLTLTDWDTSITPNDIGFIHRYLEDYAKKKGTDDNYLEIMEIVEKLKEIDKELEYVLLETRELLLDLGM